MEQGEEQPEKDWLTVAEFHHDIPPKLSEGHIRRLLRKDELKGYHGGKLGKEWIIRKNPVVEKVVGVDAESKESTMDEEHRQELSRLVTRLLYLWERSLYGCPEDCYEGLIVDEYDLKEIDPMIADCLVRHLEAEGAEFEKVKQWIDLVSLKLIEGSAAPLNKLTELKRRKTFKGTCLICESY